MVRESRSKPVTSLLKMCFSVSPLMKVKEKASTEGVEKIMRKKLSKRRRNDMSMKRVMRANCTEKVAKADLERSHSVVMVSSRR